MPLKIANSKYIEFGMYFFIRSYFSKFGKFIRGIFLETIIELLKEIQNVITEAEHSINFVWIYTQLFANCEYVHISNQIVNFYLNNSKDYINYY